MIKIFRVLKDQEYMGHVRDMGPGMVPATCPLFPSMKPGDRKRAIILPSTWRRFSEYVQPTKASFRYATSNNMGWVNEGTWPKVQQIAFESNYVIGERYDKKWIKIYTFKLSDTPPVGSPSDLRRNFPYYIHQWWNIKRKGDFRPGKNFLQPAYIILISDNGYLFVPSERVIEL